VNWSHFGMTPRGFRPSVDPLAYYPAPSHEAALAGLVAAFDRRAGVVLLDGPPGVGKSLVARVWLERLPADVPRVVLPNVPAARPADLLQAILFDLDRPYQGLGEQELRLAVTAQLLAAADHGPTVLVIDEAQNLGREALEELRLLGNIDTRDGPALFAVLVAQPALRDALRRPAFEPLAQRVAAAFALDPLPAGESAAFVRHQAKAAGNADVFDDGAVSLLAAACGGVPRVLNRAAALALDLAASAAAEVVDVEAVGEALARLGLDEPAEPAQPPPPKAGTHPPGGSADQPAPARAPKHKTARKRSA
jgi:type II secretory pathway predicted ATPase ExeA